MYLVVSDRAKKRIQEISGYIFEECGIVAYDKYLDELEHCLSIIKQNPYAFPATLQNVNVRQCVVTALNKLYYTIQEENIVILSLEDVRMNSDLMFF